MRKTFYSVLILVLLLPLLAACGGGGTDMPGTGEEVPTPFDTEVPEAGEAASPEAEASPEASPEAEMSPVAEASPEASPAAEASPQAGGDGETIRVGLVTDVGKVNDGTFNQFAYEGLTRARDELGVEINYIETAQPTDYDRNLDQFASQGYDLVIGVGFLMGDAMLAAAERHPEVQFAIVDFAYDDPPDNLKGLIFQEDQAAYMVGAMAALVTESDTIGVVGGEQIPPVERFVEGYKAGADAIAAQENRTVQVGEMVEQGMDIRADAIAAQENRTVQVLEVYIPSFTNPAAGAEAARSQIAEGADVVFGAGGQTGSGAITAAAQQGAYVIGVDQDEYNTTFRQGSVDGADRLITSALKRVDNAVFSVVEDALGGNFNNELYIGNAANGGVDYAECHDACDVITDEIIAQIDEIKQGLAGGSIETGVE